MFFLFFFALFFFIADFLHLFPLSGLVTWLFHIYVLQLLDRSTDGERWHVCRATKAARDNSIFKYYLQAYKSIKLTVEDRLPDQTDPYSVSLK